MRAIDGDALEELFREVISGIAKKPEMTGNLEHMIRASAMVVEMIQDAPTIEPERKKGKWIDKSGGIECAWNYCSVCGEQAIDLYDFCPNCGSDMRGELG